MILEADHKYADTSEVLRRIQMRTPTGGLVPLDTLARRIDKPTSLTVNHIAQLPAVIISFNLAPGIALGEAVQAIQEVAGGGGPPPPNTTPPLGGGHGFFPAAVPPRLLLFFSLLGVFIIPPT